MAPANEPLILNGPCRFREPAAETVQVPCGKNRPPGIVEGKGGEGVKYPEAAGIAAVFRFDTDDGDNHLFRNAIQGAGAGEGQLVFLPEANAAIDATFIQEARTVTFPGALQGRTRRCDQLQYFGIGAGLGKLGEQFLRLEAVALFEIDGKVDDGPFVSERGRGGRGMLVPIRVVSSNAPRIDFKSISIRVVAR